MEPFPIVIKKLAPKCYLLPILGNLWLESYSSYPDCYDFVECQVALRRLFWGNLLWKLYIGKTELKQTVKRGKKLNNHAVVDKLY